MKTKLKNRLAIVNYPVGDFIIRVKNAALASKKEVISENTKIIKQIAQVLKKMGYLDEVRQEDRGLKVLLAFKKKKPVLLDAKLISKPGLRVYMGTLKLEKKRGRSSYIVSTPKGVLSGKDAIKIGVGGEVIAEVW